MMSQQQDHHHHHRRRLLCRLSLILLLVFLLCVGPSVLLLLQHNDTNAIDSSNNSRNGVIIGLLSFLLSLSSVNNNNNNKNVIVTTTTTTTTTVMAASVPVAGTNTTAHDNKDDVHRRRRRRRHDHDQNRDHRRFHNHYNVLIYRATPAGIAAAIALGETLNNNNNNNNNNSNSNNNTREQFRVLLVESTNHVGGMATEGGIGFRDGPNDIIRTNTRSSQYRWGIRNAEYYYNNNNTNDNNNNNKNININVNNTNSNSNVTILNPIWQPDNYVGEYNFLQMLREVHPTVTLHLNTDIVEGTEGIRKRSSHYDSSGDQTTTSTEQQEQEQQITAVALEYWRKNNKNDDSDVIDNNTKTKTTAIGRNKRKKVIEWIHVDYVIDASYEGDIMVAAQVPFTYGREARTTYNESLAGVTSSSISQFRFPVDATTTTTTAKKRKSSNNDNDNNNIADNHNIADNNNNDNHKLDDDKSHISLLPYVQWGPDPRSHIGEADSHVMAYSYRVCLTKKDNNNSNAVPIVPPPNYDPKDFELARRYILAELQHTNNTIISKPWGNLVYMRYDQVIDLDHTKNMKYDACCGRSAVGIDAVGLMVASPSSLSSFNTENDSIENNNNNNNNNNKHNKTSTYFYPLASRAQRQQIAQAHRYYVQGLMWFWQNDTAIPQNIRKEHGQWGLCKDEWPDNDHFPRQLYIREGLRMVGDHVFTQNDRNINNDKNCRNDSIAVASWGFDIHAMQRVAVVSKEDIAEEETMDEREIVGSRGINEGKLIAYNEGLTSYDKGGRTPFDLPYWILLPKRTSVTNILIPNCPSVSHVAFAAVRVEPTLWFLGQAAGTAASIALRATYYYNETVTENREREIISNKKNKTLLKEDWKRQRRPTALHDVSVREVQTSLVAQGSTIHWPPSDRCSTETTWVE